MTRNAKLLVGGLGLGLAGAVALLAWVFTRAPEPRTRSARAADGDEGSRERRRGRFGRGPLGVNAPGDEEGQDESGGERDRGGRRDRFRDNDPRRRIERMMRGRQGIPEYTQPAPLDPSANQLPQPPKDRDAIRALHDKLIAMPPEEIKKQASDVAQKYPGITVKNVDCERRPCRIEISGGDPAHMAAYLDHLHLYYQGQLAGRMRLLPSEDGQSQVLTGMVTVGTSGPRPAPSETWQRSASHGGSGGPWGRRGPNAGPGGPPGPQPPPAP